MFDFGKFLGWIRDGLFEPATTWQAYKEEGHSWKVTAMQLSLPLLVAAALITLILSWMFGGSYAFGRPDLFGSFLSSILMGAAWFGVGGFLASFLAGKFGGQDNFDQAWAALTFAAIPGLAGSILGALPWIGWLLSIAGFVWSLILLWQALPVFLETPKEKQLGHYWSTLGLSIVALLVVGTLLGGLGLYRSGWGNNDWNDSDWSEERAGRSVEDRIRDRIENADSNSGGQEGRNEGSNNEDSLFGFGREIDYMEQANNDRYSPPSDGKLDEDQVELSLRFLAAAERLRDSSAKSFEQLGDDNNNEPSLSDIFKGVKGLMTAGTAEMQAVKSGGGNWAEHEWVKKQLFEARLHQDLNATTSHNYELYREYQERLDEWL